MDDLNCSGRTTLLFSDTGSSHSLVISQYIGPGYSSNFLDINDINKFEDNYIAGLK